MRAARSTTAPVGRWVLHVAGYWDCNTQLARADKVLQLHCSSLIAVNSALDPSVSKAAQRRFDVCHLFACVRPTFAGHRRLKRRIAMSAAIQDEVVARTARVSTDYENSSRCDVGAWDTLVYAFCVQSAASRSMRDFADSSQLRSARSRRR